MSDLELTPNDEDVTIEVDLDHLSEQIGSQMVISEDELRPEFGYLAALALETRCDARYDVEDTLMEFIRNSSALDVDAQDCEEISLILGEK